MIIKSIIAAITFLTLFSFGLNSAMAQGHHGDMRTGIALNAYVEGFNSLLAKGEIDKWLETWENDAKRIGPTNQQQGKAEIRAIYQQIFEMYADMKMTENSRSEEGLKGTIEATFEATIKPSGREVSFPVKIILDVSPAGKIDTMEVEYDVDEVVRQLNAKTA